MSGGRDGEELDGGNENTLAGDAELKLKTDAGDAELKLKTDAGDAELKTDAGDAELKTDAGFTITEDAPENPVTVSAACDQDNQPDETTISNNDEEQVISVTPVPAQECEDKILNVSEDKIAEKAPSVDDLKTLDEKSLMSEVAGSQPLRTLSTPVMSGFIEAEELGDETNDNFVVVGDSNKRGEEELRNLVKDHETRLSTASVSKLSSGDKPRVKRVSQQNLRNLQRDVEKLKEIDPDYLKTLNRHNNTVDVSSTQTSHFLSRE